jgi:hypothetical protein
MQTAKYKNINESRNFTDISGKQPRTMFLQLQLIRHRFCFFVPRILQSSVKISLLKKL